MEIFETLNVKERPKVNYFYIILCIKRVPLKMAYKEVPRVNFEELKENFEKEA